MQRVNRKLMPRSANTLRISVTLWGVYACIDKAHDICYQSHFSSIFVPPARSSLQNALPRKGNLKTLQHPRYPRVAVASLFSLQLLRRR